MTPRILFNFATRSRPKRFEKAMQNILAHVKSDRFSICVKYDRDDMAMRQWSMFNREYKNTLYYVGDSISKVHAINRDIPTTGWDILVNMSDDIVWTMSGFDNIIREHCGADDFVLFPEPYASKQMNAGRNGLISVVSIMGYEYYKRDGYVYHPSYKRTHCDNEATEVAKLRGRFKQVNQTLFYHEHPAAGYKVRDEQYLLERSTWHEDSLNYKNRKEAGFPE